MCTVQSVIGNIPSDTIADSILIMSRRVSAIVITVGLTLSPRGSATAAAVATESEQNDKRRLSSYTDLGFKT